MMLRPAMTDIIHKDQCYYSFVIAIAKRARQITDDYVQNNKLLEEKAVDLAVNEFADGIYAFVENGVEVQSNEIYNEKENNANENEQPVNSSNDFGNIE